MGGGARRASSGDGELWLKLGQRPRHFRQSLASVRSGVYVALQDANAVDAHHAHAKAAGAVIAMPLEDTDYGSRQYSVWDGDHRLWCFGTYDHAPFGEPTLCLVLRYPDRPATTRWLAHAFRFEPRSRAALPAGRSSARNFVSATVPCG